MSTPGANAFVLGIITLYRRSFLRAVVLTARKMFVYHNKYQVCRLPIQIVKL